MKSGRRFTVVLVTAPDIRTARRLAGLAVKARLAACASLIPGIESHYWWKEKIERGSEVLMILKTAVNRLSSLEKLILTHHPYDTPEILALPITAGTSHYLQWTRKSLRV